MIVIVWPPPRRPLSGETLAMAKAGASGGVAITPVHGVPLLTCPARKSGPEYTARSATKVAVLVDGQAPSALSMASRNVAKRCPESSG